MFPNMMIYSVVKVLMLAAIHKECLFSLYADAAAGSKMCDSGGRESNPLYPLRLRLIRPALSPMSYRPETEKDRVSGFPSKRSLIILYS